MSRTVELTVLCEGPTEVGFVRSVLGPHLESRGVFPKALPLGRISFGTITFDTLRKSIAAAVGNARGHQFTTCMVDLYALRGFPGQDDPAATPQERVQNIERAMAEQLPSPQWIPYVQLHEFEALLYVELDELAASFPGSDITAGLAALKSEVTGLSPEDIDDGRETAPSKRLLKHIPIYAKAATGPAVAARIGLHRLRSACPHFGAWLHRLEGLAAAGRYKAKTRRFDVKRSPSP